MMKGVASRETLLAILAINSLTFVFAMLRAPKYVDFYSFYSSGRIARSAPTHIYDLKYQLHEQRGEFGDTQGAFLPFFHPPHELLLFVPLSELPFSAALNIWRLFSVVCLVLSGLLLAAAMGSNRLDTLLLCTAGFPALLCIAVGQDSFLVMVLISACFYLLKTDRDVLAALVLALALFKPQLPVVLALAMLAIGKNKFFAWFAAFGSALAAASLIYVGWDQAVAMARASEIGDHTGGLGIATMTTVRGLLAFLGVDSRALAFAILVAGVLAMVPLWRCSRSLEFATATSICLESAVAIHLYPYDSVVLAIPLLIVLDAGKTAKPILTPVIAAITSAPLGLLAFRAKIPSLLVLPTLALLYLSLQLREEQVGGIRRILAHAPSAPEGKRAATPK